MAFRILQIPAGTTFFLQETVSVDGFGNALLNLSGLSFAFGAVTDPADPDSEVLLAANSAGGGITSTGLTVRVAITDLASLELDTTYHWYLHAKDATGRIWPVSSGLLSRSATPSLDFGTTTAGALVADNDGTLLADNDGTLLADNPA